MTDFINAYNYGRRLKTLKGLTPYEYVCKIWKNDPKRFMIKPTHQMMGLYSYLRRLGRGSSAMELVEYDEDTITIRMIRKTEIAALMGVLIAVGADYDKLERELLDMPEESFDRFSEMFFNIVNSASL